MKTTSQKKKKTPINAICVSFNEFLYEPGFLNLVQGVHALNTARKSFRDLIEKYLKHFIARLPNTEKEQLGSFIHCVNHHGMKLDFASTQTKPLICGHENCELLYTRLRKISYVTGDISAEKGVESLLQGTQPISYTDSGFKIWDLAYCFIGVKTQSLKLHGPEMNVKTLIKLMKNCRMFAFKDSERIYSQVLEDIDNLLYAKDLLISKEDLELLFDHLLELLGNWQDSCQSCSYGVEDIRKIQHVNADCENFEYKLLVKNVLEIIKGMLNDSKRESDLPTYIKSKDVSSSKELISSLLSQVEEMVSKQEPNEILELKQEIESLEEENKKLQKEIVIEKSKRKAKMKESRELQDKMKQLEADNESVKTTLAQAQRDLSDTKQRKKRLEEKRSKLQMEMDKMMSAKDEEMTKNKECELEMKKLERDLERQKTTLAQAQRDLSDTKQRKKRLEEERSKLQMEIAKMKTTLAQAQRDLSDTKQGKKRLEEEHFKLEMEKAKMMSSKDEEMTKGKALESKLRALERYFERQKTTLAQAQIDLSYTKQEKKRLEEEQFRLEMEKAKMKTTLAQAQKDFSDTKLEKKRLEEEHLKLQTEIAKMEYGRKSEIMGNRELQEKVTRLERHSCIERLRLYNIWKKRYYNENHSSWMAKGRGLLVSSFGSFQDFVLKIDGLTILFDPYDAVFLKDVTEGNWFSKTLTDNFYNFEFDVVALSACAYSFSESTVMKIVQRNRNVKWVIPPERKDWLIRLGVDITSITEFGFWDENHFNIRHQDISFVCTPTHRNSELYGSKLCNTCGWIVKGSTIAFYSSGFTNYNEEIFSRVERHGPFYFALLPIADIPENMSCSPDFHVDIDEILEMHRKLHPRESLGIETPDYWRFNSKNNKQILMEKMKTLQSNSQRFQRFRFLEPDKPLFS